jgi:hypothetical protein
VVLDETQLVGCDRLFRRNGARTVGVRGHIRSGGCAWPSYGLMGHLLARAEIKWRAVDEAKGDTGFNSPFLMLFARSFLDSHARRESQR